MLNNNGRLERKDELLRTAMMLARGGADDATLLEWYRGLAQSEREQLLDSLGGIIETAMSGLSVIAAQVSEASPKVAVIFDNLGGKLFEAIGELDMDFSLEGEDEKQSSS